jgi:hypothetical protein
MRMQRRIYKIVIMVLSTDPKGVEHSVSDGPGNDVTAGLVAAAMVFDRIIYTFHVILTDCREIQMVFVAVISPLRCSPLCICYLGIIMLR